MRLRVWVAGADTPPQVGQVAHEREVTFVEATGNVWWIDERGEGVSTLSRWVEWEKTGDEMVKERRGG